jgi:hypothetical protein
LKENKVEKKKECPDCLGYLEYKGKLDNDGVRKLYQCSSCKNIEIIYE